MQRGAAVVAAAYALRRGDAAGLTELGLNLADLVGLGAMTQCGRILQAILGNETHPDEYALRRAAADAAKTIITSPEEPEPIGVVRDFIASFVWQQGLVELRAQRSAGADARTVANQEDRIKRWIRARVRSVAAPATGTMTVRGIIDSAASIAQSALRIIAAGTTA